MDDKTLKKLKREVREYIKKQIGKNTMLCPRCRREQIENLKKSVIEHIDKQIETLEKEKERIKDV